MWKMTLKQRRRHRELVAEFDRARKDPHIELPADYEFGKDDEQDAKYKAAAETLNAIVTEMHVLEEAARQRT